MGLRNLYDGFVDLLKHTALEIYLGVFLVAAGGATLRTQLEYNRSEFVPLSFSEKTQIEKDEERRGRKTGAMTVYLTSANDACMKIFEAHNESRSPFGNEDRAFAKELEHAKDEEFRRHHYTLTDLLTSLPAEGAAALELMKDYVESMRNLSPVIDHFNRAWDDRHIDEYHTECSQVCSTDSEGNESCHDECHQVYDYTDHYYDYFRVHGELAAESLGNALTAHPQLHLNDSLPTASKTNADGEYAAEKTHELEEDRITFSEEEFMAFASTWKRGSTVWRNLNPIQHGWGALHQDHPLWLRAKGTAQSTSYRTYSHSDSGPREFQVAEQALEHAVGTQRAIAEIVNSITFTMGNAPDLLRTVNEYIAVVLDHKEGDVDKLEERIMDTAKTMYIANFKAGENLDQFRWWMVGLFALGFAVPGAGLGLLWDLWNKKRWGTQEERRRWKYY